MKAFIDGHHVVTGADLVELALGTPLDLWLGPGGDESEEERAAREGAARDILAEDPALADHSERVMDRALRALVEAATQARAVAEVEVRLPPAREQPNPAPAKGARAA